MEVDSKASVTDSLKVTKIKRYPIAQEQYRRIPFIDLYKLLLASGIDPAKEVKFYYDAMKGELVFSQAV